MRRKKQVTINLKPETVEKARHIGLNISKISENALQQVIKRLETPKTNPNTEITHNDGLANTMYRKHSSRSSRIQWTGRDLNPRPPECKSGVHAN